MLRVLRAQTAMLQMELFGWFTALADRPALFFCAVVFATFMLEDVATLTLGLLAALMMVDPLLTISALIVGTLVGDVGLYLLSREARRSKFVARLIARPQHQPLIARLHARAAWWLVLARATPGLRLPVFVGAGTIAYPFERFLVIAACSTLLWTPLLFVIGMQTGMADAGDFVWLAPAILLFLWIGHAATRRLLAAGQPAGTRG